MSKIQRDNRVKPSINDEIASLSRKLLVSRSEVIRRAVDAALADKGMPPRETRTERVAYLVDPKLHEQFAKRAKELNMLESELLEIGVLYLATQEF